jgi:NADPH-dependent ferric siderophore reductase
VKAFINPPPDGPTPSGYVYYLPNPAQNDKPVSFDDCEKPTSISFEIKGEGLAKLTNDLAGMMAYNFIEQATRQVAASAGRPVVWIFAEEQAALFARELFDDTLGLERITV